MATGPEHYRQAEEYLEKAYHMDPGTDLERFYIAAAQAHATLAVAAATAMGAVDPPPRDWEAWHKAAGTKPSTSAPEEG